MKQVVHVKNTQRLKMKLSRTLLGAFCVFAVLGACRRTQSSFERPFDRLAASACIDDKTNIACFGLFASRPNCSLSGFNDGFSDRLLGTAAQASPPGNAEQAIFESCEIFPLVREHVHGSTIVELPNGDLLSAWFQGSGERWADDVKIMGARRRAKGDRWSTPFVMADVPGFPDINPILFLDPHDRLWLMWYTVIANQWETSLIKYRISEDYQRMPGAPEWSWQDVLHVKPGDPTERGMQPQDRFVKSVERQIKAYGDYLSQHTPAATASRIQARWEAWGKDLLAKARGEDMIRRGRLVDATGASIEKPLGYPYFRRMGWQTKNKPIIINDKRIIVPLYSDGFSFSLMALTDDCGQTWQFSEPLVGPGNIQAAIACKTDGTLVTYMRDNGPPPQRLHVSTSRDQGVTWSPVQDASLPNPGSGADVVTLHNGHWVLAYNDTEDGRHSLAVSLSTDAGKTWAYTRHLEHDLRDRRLATSSAYPAIIQARDGVLHVVYSYHHRDRQAGPHKTIKHVKFNEAWLRQSIQKEKTR